MVNLVIMNTLGYSSNRSLSIKLKSSIKLYLARVSLKFFGNTLGVKTNFFYGLQHFMCRLFSRSLIVAEPWAAQKAKEIHENGFTKIDPRSVEELARRVGEFFSLMKIENGAANLPRENAATLAPIIYELVLGDVEQVLSAYYGSFVQPYWINIMRYVKGDRTPDSSFGYHIDDNPKQLLKIFIYLNDTFESNGAFRTFNYQKSRELIGKGFISSSEELRCDSQKYITPEDEKSNLQILEGRAGTVLIFDNNLIHKGTLPRTGYRDVVCIEIYPSDRCWRLDDFKKGLQIPITIDYPANPFYNDAIG